MKRYKVIYWYGGNKMVVYVEGESLSMAQYNFYMNVPCDDVISIEVEE